MLHPISKQAYKIELPKKRRIYDVFYISLLEQDITKREQMDKTRSWMEFENNSGSEEYKFEAIYDNAIYINKLESYLSGFYYLIL